MEKEHQLILKAGLRPRNGVGRRQTAPLHYPIAGSSLSAISWLSLLRSTYRSETTHVIGKWGHGGPPVLQQSRYWGQHWSIDWNGLSVIDWFLFAINKTVRLFHQSECFCPRLAMHAIFIIRLGCERVCEAVTWTLLVVPGDRRWNDELRLALIGPRPRSLPPTSVCHRLTRISWRFVRKS